MSWFLKLSQRVTQGEVLITSLIPKMITRIQKLYDEWDQSGEFGDPELGFGGICQDFAEIIADVINEVYEAHTVSQTMGDQHVYVVARMPDGVYYVDIPPNVYETGGGYTWKKIEGVKFEPGDFIIDRLSSDPNRFDEFTGEY